VDYYLEPEPSQQFLHLFKIQRPSEQQLKAEKVAVNANIVSRNGNKSCCLITKIIGNFQERNSVAVLRSEGASYYLRMSGEGSRFVITVPRVDTCAGDK